MPVAAARGMTNEVPRYASRRPFGRARPARQSPSSPDVHASRLSWCWWTKPMQHPPERKRAWDPPFASLTWRTQCPPEGDVRDTLRVSRFHQTRGSGHRGSVTRAPRCCHRRPALRETARQLERLIPSRPWTGRLLTLGEDWRSPGRRVRESERMRDKSSLSLDVKRWKRPGWRPRRVSNGRRAFQAWSCPLSRDGGEYE
jgi:hypothetical protein